MLFIEVLVPAGVFDEGTRRRIAKLLTGRRLISAPEGDASGADPGVIDLYDSLTQVVVREEEVWTGGEPVRDPLYIVRVTIGMWAKETGDHVVTQVIAALAEVDGNPQPRAVVNVIGVPEGGYGVNGRVHRSEDMIRVMEEAKTGMREPLPDGMVVDPVCGAVVPLTEAVTLERDGRTYGFCCPHCRGHFANRLKAGQAS